MKSEVSLLNEYPLFRLTVCMIAGIFLFDRFPSPDDGLWLSLSVFTISFLLLLLSYRGNIVFRTVLFGLFSSLCFFAFGGFLTALSCRQVDYDWSTQRELYSGVVEEAMKEKERTQAYRVKVLTQLPTTLMADTCPKAVDRRVVLYLLKDSVPLTLDRGDTLCFFSRLSKPTSAVPYPNFNYAEVLRHDGISGTAPVYRGHWYVKGRCTAPDLKQWALRLRDSVAYRIDHLQLGSEQVAVVKALSIGDKRQLTVALKERYTIAGVSHILALSGMHVGIIGGLAFFLLSPISRMRYGRQLRLFAVVLLLWGFAFLTGLSASVVRAVSMFTLFALASVVLDEPFFSCHALSLTAFLMLVYNPFYIFHVGFQLSFMAVLSIIMFYPLVRRLFGARGRIMAYVSDVLSLSIAAQAGTLPLILYYFGAFPTYFLLANLMVVPMVFVVLTITLGVVLLYPFGLVRHWGGRVLDWLASGMNEAMDQIAHLAGAQMTSLYANLFQTLLLLILLFLLYRCVLKRSCVLMKSILAMLAVLLLSILAGRMKADPDVLYLSQKEVYLKHGHRMTLQQGVHGIYRVGPHVVGVIKDNEWKYLQSEVKLRIDYLYVCRGYSGDMAHLNRLFDIGRVVIDCEVGLEQRNSLVAACQKLKLAYCLMSEQGALPIEL